MNPGLAPLPNLRSKCAAWTCCVLLTPALAEAQYIQRFSATTNGAITFSGNTLGLDGEVNQHGQGTRGAVGTFITTDTSLRDDLPAPSTAPLFPFGTTSDWRLNRSQAILRLPSGARVLRAELVWGGSFADSSGENVSAFLDNAISFTTPAGTLGVAPDPATAKTSGTASGDGTCARCYYVRTADVTALVTAGGPGTYTVGRVPATRGTTDNRSPAAGWTLAVVYEDFAQPIRVLTLMLGLEAAGATAQAAGFCTPSSGPINGRLAVTAMEGDAGMSGDQMRFGQTASLNIGDRVDGPRNPKNNFFSSQIVRDDGSLATGGTFGNRNHTPNAPVAGARQGWDITNVDVSSALKKSQTAAFAQGTTSGGDVFWITALGFQIDVSGAFVPEDRREVSRQIDGTRRRRSHLHGSDRQLDRHD
jgi:large repetitive protein